ncbi:uncharacterized protein B0H18DRAFT_675882 [Fomitopsis serialis]|uniref:uncharacterized protein n=1 Tax=Fomitopsis serialis TaxID=139415 RepID=UPI002007B420|nr:uncharacterized protein B0H18DRAFT_675882 [Neoantrodia serialis]KAH9933064.1 hypothetical protein B0H18DRAFT_675882 [Neoantrodia serialis]
MCCRKRGPIGRLILGCSSLDRNMPNRRDRRIQFDSVAGAFGDYRERILHSQGEWRGGSIIYNTVHLRHEKTRSRGVTQVALGAGTGVASGRRRGRRMCSLSFAGWRRRGHRNKEDKVGTPSGSQAWSSDAPSRRHRRDGEDLLDVGDDDREDMPHQGRSMHRAAERGMCDMNCAGTEAYRCHCDGLERQAQVPGPLRAAACGMV